MKTINDMTPSQKQALKDDIEHWERVNVKVKFIGFNHYEPEKAMFMYTYPDGTTQKAFIGKRGSHSFGLRV